MHVYPNYYKKKFLLFFFTEYKNEWKEHKFWRQKNQKSAFYNKNKKIFNINYIDVNKILVSKKEQYGKYNSFKHFIVYNDNDAIRPLYLELSQMIGYINEFDKNKNKNKNTITTSLMVKDKQRFKNYNKIMEKNWKVNEYRFWQQTCLWQWWQIHKNKNKNIWR